MMTTFVSAVVSTSLLLAVGSARAQGLVPDCTLPFASIAKHHPIDDNCAARGEADEDPDPNNVDAHALQNQAKNNFCATSQSPALVTFITFKKLQEKLDQKAPEGKTWKKANLPKNRGLFRDIMTSDGTTIGEGSVVTLAAWLMKIRPGSGESCNCGTNRKKPPADAIDVHLVLAEKKSVLMEKKSKCTSAADETLECQSVTAEVSPHFRPDQWNQDTICSAARDHPLRFTGQLMYDAAHRPCPDKRRGDPSRISGWEIHPVYAIDVCTEKSLDSCKADNDSVWTPLDQRHQDE